MRYGESLMQVEVAYISTYMARTGKPDLGIHVGTVHVNQAAVLMHYVDHFPDGLFKNAMS
jgi:hypothetical protein